MKLLSLVENFFVYNSFPLNIFCVILRRQLIFGCQVGILGNNARPCLMLAIERTPNPAQLVLQSGEVAGM